MNHQKQPVFSLDFLHISRRKSSFLTWIAPVFLLYLPSLKVIVYILAAFLLALSCYPCGQDNCEDHEEFAAGVSHDDEQRESGGQDACTPFCIDGCCPTHLLCQGSTPKIAAPLANRSIASVLFKQPSVKSIDYSIWQPPRIVWPYFLSAFCGSFIYQL